MAITFRGRAAWGPVSMGEPAGSDPCACLGDIETRLRSRLGAASPLLGDLARFGDCVNLSDRHFLLDRCEHDAGGRFALAVHVLGARAEAAPYDEYLGGVWVLGDTRTGRLCVSPRILRLVSRLGAIVPVIGRFPTEEYVRTTAHDVHGDLDAVVHAAFSARVVEAAAHALRAAMRIPARDPVEALLRRGIRLARSERETLATTFGDEGEPTLYGVFLALLGAAQRALDLADRDRLERLAGTIVEALTLAGPVLARG